MSGYTIIIDSETAAFVLLKAFSSSAYLKNVYFWVSLVKGSISSAHLGMWFLMKLMQPINVCSYVIVLGGVIAKIASTLATALVCNQLELLWIQGMQLPVCTTLIFWRWLEVQHLQVVYE